MKKLLLRCVVLLLLFCICISAFAGCKKDTEEAQSDETVTTSNYEDDDLPDDLDYGGREVKILTWKEVLDVDFAEEISGNIINDKTYQSRKNVEARLNVNFSVTAEPGNWDNKQMFATTLETRLISGEIYDIVGQYTPAAALCAMKGLYQNFADSKYLNLSKPWWPGNIKESCSIGGNVYFCAGDITATCINAIGTVAVNLDMMEEYKIEENIYDVVNNKQWTLEKMKSMFLGVVGTVDGDAAETQKYGIAMINRGVYDNLFFSGGFRFIHHDNEDQLIISSDLASEKIETWFASCRDLLKENPDVISGTVTGDTEILENIFVSERSIVFMSQELNEIKNYIKNASFDFAIVPYPMYDENQGNYHTITGYWVTMFSIPYNAPDAELSEITLEALGSDAYRNLTPTVYVDAFQNRFLETEENAQMLDLIHDSIIYDTGRIFTDDIQDMWRIFRQAHEAAWVSGTHESWSSVYGAWKTPWESSIEDITNTLG